MSSSTRDFHHALQTCSFECLRTVYLYASVALSRHQTPAVTPAEMEAAPERVRPTMEEHLKHLFPVERLSRGYRTAIFRQLASMGGVKITACVNRKKAESFVYTCGFTAIGGKELIVPDVHRSWTGQLGATLNHLFTRHKEGHPLEKGHTIYSSAVVLLVMGGEAETPESSKAETTLLKATKMLEPTRLYGLNGYDVLVLAPVGVPCSSDDGETRQPTRDEALLLSIGFDVVEGFRSLVVNPDPDDGGITLRKKNTMCSWCHGTAAALERPLDKCAACQNAFYCSKECQRRDWKLRHKEACRRTEEESKEMAMNFLFPVEDLINRE